MSYTSKGFSKGSKGFSKGLDRNPYILLESIFKF